MIIYGDANSSRQQKKKKVVRISTSGNSKLLGFFNRGRGWGEKIAVEKLENWGVRTGEKFNIPHANIQCYYFHLRVRITTMPSPSPPPSLPKKQHQFTSFGIPFSLFNAAVCVCTLRHCFRCWLFIFVLREIALRRRVYTNAHRLRYDSKAVKAIMQVKQYSMFKPFNQ